MTGFFTKQQTGSVTRPDGKVYSCVGCGLYKGDLDHPKMQPTGNFKKKILNIGEFTTGRDDRKGKPFQDKGASTLYKIYNSLGIDIDEDCLNVNAVMCHPYNHKTGKGRIPTPYEMQCCRLNILKIIKQHKPDLIVLFGKIALDSVIGFRMKEGLGSMNKWRGWVIPDQYYKCWIAPVFAPSFVQQGEVAAELIWRQDLENAIAHLDKPFLKYKEPKITYLKKDLTPLLDIKSMTKCAFDYETTGLKPHAKGHSLICCSIADSIDHVYAFMLIDEKQRPLKEKRVKPFKQFLLNKNIPKIAQHLKFEENWSFFKLGVRVKGWFHDTMYWTHIFDNRTGITGLKFQAYVMFGMGDYSSDIKQYLKAKDANSINTLMQYVKSKRGEKACLKYCALDSILELRLAMLQLEKKNQIVPF
jgi:DNA polymerase